ncbi:hypothetical protein JCM8097_006173 [Rhodosporidiobolus ruineniae]
MVGLEQLEEEVRQGEEREKEELERRLREETARAEENEENGSFLDPTLPSAEPPSGDASDDEVEHMLRAIKAPSHDQGAEKAGQARLSGRGVDDLEVAVEDDDDDIDGVPITLSSPLMSPPPSATGGEGFVAIAGPAQVASTDESTRSANGTSAESSHSVEQSNTRLLTEFWRHHVSRYHPPHFWLHQDPHPPLTDNSLPLPTRSIGCTLTLRLPDTSTRTFSVSTSAGHVTRKAARNAASGLVLTSQDLLEEAKRQRAELGPEDVEQEKAKEREGKSWAETVEKPYEVLTQAAQKWVAAGEVRWEFQTDELNTTHGCTLFVPITSDDVRTFTVPTTYSSHREAKDAAAREALKSDVPKFWEEAYQQRMQVDSGGYITFASSTGAGAVASRLAQTGDDQPATGDGTVNPIELLGQEVRAALGGVAKWMSWSYTTVAPEVATSSTTATTGQPLISASLSISFPTTVSSPTRLPSLTYSVPPRYQSKHHAYTACALAAYRDGIVEKLKPFKDERAAEAERKKGDRERVKVERKLKPVPKTGTVKWEDLEARDKPIEYLNQCAQAWTGNGSPLKFEYTAVEPAEGGKQKHHGCSVSVVISSTLTKVYTVRASSATPTRRAAKEAAVRLALRERVLDLMMPPGFDPLDLASSKSGSKKAKKREKEKDKEGVEASAKTARVGAGPRSAPPSLSGQHGGKAKRATEELDRFCKEWLGAGFVPDYDVRQNAGGFFGAVLRIPLPPTSPHLPPPEPKTYWVDFAHRDRASAQESVATFALRDGVAEQIRREVPPVSARGGAAGGRRIDYGRPIGGPGAGPFGTRGRSGAGEAEGGGGPAFSPPVQQPPPAGRASLPPKPSGSIHDPLAEGALTMTSSKRPLPTTSAEAISLAEPAAKKQRYEGPGSDGAVEGDKMVDGVVDEHDDGADDAGAVAELRRDLVEKLGTEAEKRMVFKLTTDGSAFGASVSVPLSQHDEADSRTFRLPSTYLTKRAARTAAAQAALDAGVLELIESRSRMPVLSSGVKAKQQRHQRGEQKQVVRTTEEQEQARRAAYGGLGAAAAVVKPPALAPSLSTVLPVSSALPPSVVPGGGGGLVDPTLAKGKTVLALEAFCLKHGLAGPAFTRVREGEKQRVFVVVGENRFELPKVPEKDAEERLAGKLLKHLQKEASGKKEEDAAPA